MSAADRVQQHPVYIQAANKANFYVNQLDKELSKYPIANTFEQRTQIPKSYAALGTVILFGVLLLFNPLANPVSNLVGWGLPAYLSFKAIESPGVQDDVQWLTYWVVFGFFNVAESVALRIVLYYFPRYFAVKAIFLLWLQLPAFRGAQTIYHAALKPFVHTLNQSGSVTTSTHATAENIRSRVDAASE